MGIFGSKPKLRARSAGFNLFSDEILRSGVGEDAFGEDAGGLTAAVQSNLRDLAKGRKSDLKSVSDARAADLQFAASRGGPTVTSADATANAIARGKGLSRVVSATKTEFDQSLLQQRIAAVRGGFRRQGKGLAALSAAAKLDENLAKQKDITSNVKSDLKGDIFGAVVGAGASAATNFLDRDKIKEFDVSKIPKKRTLEIAPSFSNVQGGTALEGLGAFA